MMWFLENDQGDLRKESGMKGTIRLGGEGPDVCSVRRRLGVVVRGWLCFFPGVRPGGGQGTKFSVP